MKNINKIVKEILTEALPYKDLPEKDVRLYLNSTIILLFEIEAILQLKKEGKDEENFESNVDDFLKTVNKLLGDYYSKKPY